MIVSEHRWEWNNRNREASSTLDVVVKCIRAWHMHVIAHGALLFQEITDQGRGSRHVILSPTDYSYLFLSFDM